MIGAVKSKINHGFRIYPLTPSKGCTMGFHEVDFWDLGLNRVRRLCASDIGEPVHRWVYTGMPRLHPQLQDCVFFLYGRNPSTGAIDGPLGSGFFVSRSPAAKPGLNHLYAVTNWHVAVRLGASIVRLNQKDGTTRFLDYEPSDWTFNADEDLAIIDVHDDLRPNDGISHINERQFLAGGVWSRSGLTIGDDAFMIGLFAGHHGGDWNVPCARFGNVAMLSSLHAKVKMTNGSEQPCHLVDCHSRGGFSGSPVFVYRTSGSDLTNLSGKDVWGRDKPTNVLFALLGIHCGQFWEEIEFQKSDQIAVEHSRRPITEGDKLSVPSSMTTVMPAWRISNLLDSEPLEILRMKREVGWRQAQANTPRSENAPKPKASPLASDENPNAREDFTSLLNVAAQKPKQGD